MKQESKESAAEKIKDLRNQVANDKKDKIRDGQSKRRAGEPSGEGEDQEKGEKRAGGVTWDVPKEMEQVDYTRQEREFVEIVQGPKKQIFENIRIPSQEHGGRDGETAPSTAQELLREAQRLADGPVLGAAVGQERHQRGEGRGGGRICILLNTVGVNIDTVSEKMSLPEARVLKGAYLLAEPQFNFGEKTVTLKEMQRFRGIATGWSVVVKGLKNELKAADRFLGGSEGGARANPSKCMTVHEEEQAWEDLWMLFEDCRWSCSRSETWAEKFGGDIREALAPLERLALPAGQFRTAVFVSSDATPTVLGSIDWTHGLVCRQEVEELKPWIVQVLAEEEINGEGPLAIHLGEMLSFVAFACAVGARWTGKVVLYGGDNKTVYHWVTSRRSGIRSDSSAQPRRDALQMPGYWRMVANIPQ